MADDRGAELLVLDAVADGIVARLAAVSMHQRVEVAPRINPQVLVLPWKAKAGSDSSRSARVKAQPRVCIGSHSRTCEQTRWPV